MLDFELALFETNAHHAAMDSVPKLTTDAAGNPKPRGRTRFQPGQSGNPKGKPRGAKNRVLLALDKIGVDNAAPVLSAAVAAAKAAAAGAPAELVANLEAQIHGIALADPSLMKALRPRPSIHEIVRTATTAPSRQPRTSGPPGDRPAGWRSTSCRDQNAGRWIIR